MTRYLLITKFYQKFSNAFKFFNSPLSLIFIKTDVEYPFMIKIYKVLFSAFVVETCGRSCFFFLPDLWPKYIMTNPPDISSIRWNQQILQTLSLLMQSKENQIKRLLLQRNILLFFLPIPYINV